MHDGNIKSRRILQQTAELNWPVHSQGHNQFSDHQRQNKFRGGCRRQNIQIYPNKYTIRLYAPLRIVTGKSACGESFSLSIQGFSGQPIMSLASILSTLDRLTQILSNFLVYEKLFVQNQFKLWFRQVQALISMSQIGCQICGSEKSSTKNAQIVIFR